MNTMDKNFDRRMRARIQVPEYLTHGRKKNIRSLGYGLLTLLGLFGTRTFIQAFANPEKFHSELLLLKAFADQVLTGVQMGATPDQLVNPLLVSGDLVAGLGIATLAGIGVTLGTNIAHAHGEINRTRDEILAQGELEGPLGLVGHTVVLAQTMPFTGAILTDLHEKDNVPPFLVSAVGANQFNPYEHRNQKHEPPTPFWKSTPTVHDDDILTITDLPSASRMVLLAAETDKLILLRNNEQSGLSQDDVENALITAYKMNPNLHSLLVLPSRREFDAGFEASLTSQGVPVGSRCKIQYIDDLMTGSVQTKLTKLRGEEVALEMGDYGDEALALFRNAGVKVSAEAETVLIYDKNDSRVLKQARRIKTEGKRTPILILDTQAEISQAKREGMEYICIEELVRSAIINFTDETKPEIQNYHIPIPGHIKAIVYNHLELVPLSLQKAAAIHLLKEAIINMGEADLFRLIDGINMVLFPRHKYWMNRPSAKDMSHVSHRREFKHRYTSNISGHESYCMVANSQTMKRLLKEDDGIVKVTPSELIDRFFGTKMVDRKMKGDIKAILQALYVLGYVYKTREGELIRYPIKNSTLREMLQELKIIEDAPHA